MPQDSRPPEPPPDYEVDEEAENQVNPLADNRNEAVENALQDIVLFAQDFLDVVDDLDIEPIVPQAIFFPRPVRPAGRFMLPVRGGGNFRPHVPPDNVMRPRLFGRRIPGVNFIPQVRPGDIPPRPAGLLGRPIGPAGNFGEIARPGRPYVGMLRRQEHRADIFEGPEEEDLEQAQAGPAAELGSPGTVDAYPGSSVAVVADLGRPAVMDCEPRRDFAEGVGPSRSLTESVGPITPSPGEADFNRPVVESSDPSRLSAVVGRPHKSAVLSAEPDRFASTGTERDRSAAIEANVVRPLLIGAEVVQSAATGTVSEEPSASMSQQESQCPLPLKRARMDNLEPERAGQSKEDVLDKANEDSSESNGDD